MRLEPRPWMAVSAGDVIVGPSGQVWLVENVMPGVNIRMAHLVDPEDSWPQPPRRTTIVVTDDAPVNVFTATTAGALAVLRRHFPLAEQIG